MQRLDTETASETREFQRGFGNYQYPHSTAAADHDSISSVSYYLDNLSLAGSGIEHAFLLPSRELADRLLNAYLESVDTSFPIIRRRLFIGQYRSFFSGAPEKSGKKWQAILNLIFAIGARFCRLSQPGFPGDINHEIFFSRARVLSSGVSILFEHPDLQQVQIAALTSFYFLGSSQINRYVFAHLHVLSASIDFASTNHLSKEDGR